MVLLAAPISNEFLLALQEKYTCESNFLQTENYKNVVGIVTSTKLQINAVLLQQMPNLQWIARLGSGLEIMDTDLLNKKNIFYCSSPAGIANAVAEHCIALLIGLQKNIFTSVNQVANAQWIREPNRGVELEGKTVGIVGFGHTGSAFAKKLSIFGCKVIFYDKYQTIKSEFATQVTWEHLCKEAQIVSFHLPANTETNNYYNAQDFTNPHILINTSRGSIASTASILHGFSIQKLQAAGLDVVDFEHLQPFEQAQKNLLQNLLQYNCIITPHIAGYSHNAVQKMSAELLGKLQMATFL